MKNMEQSASVEVDPQKKRAYFESFARAHMPEMRVLLEEGKLWKKDGWRNVVEHCVMAATATDVLTEALEFPAADRGRMVRSQLVHDWEKRLEKRPQDFSAAERDEAYTALRALGVDQRILEATGPEFIYRDRVLHDTNFEERLRAYVDDICRQGEVVRLRERIAEVRARRQDLDNDPELTARLGGKYWDKDLEFAEAAQREIFDRLAERGIDIGAPEEVPGFINRRIRERIAAGPVPERERRFRLDMFTEERRSDPGKNEDQMFVRESDRVILAGVFDGATALADIPYFREIGKSPGRLAAEIARDVLETSGEDLASEELIFRINRTLRERAEALPVPPEAREELFTTMGLIARLDKETGTLDLARLGDSITVIMSADGSCRWITDERTEGNERQQIMKGVEVAAREGIPMAQTLMQPEVNALVTAHRRLENDPSGTGYGALKGSPEEAIRPYIMAEKIPLRPGDRVFLLSDGMLVNLFTDAEREAAEAALRSGGIRELLRHTRELEERDADLTAWPRFKQFDDATAVEIGRER